MSDLASLLAAIDVPERADDPCWSDPVWMRTTILRFVALRRALPAPEPAPPDALRLQKALVSVRSFLEGQCVQPNEQTLVREFDIVERAALRIRGAGEGDL
jgi:hypothetical protein